MQTTGIPLCSGDDCYDSVALLQPRCTKHGQRSEVHSQKSKTRFAQTVGFLFIRLFCQLLSATKVLLHVKPAEASPLGDLYAPKKSVLEMSTLLKAFLFSRFGKLNNFVCQSLIIPFQVPTVKNTEFLTTGVVNIVIPPEAL